jgi:hypothetical protein
LCKLIDILFLRYLKLTTVYKMKRSQLLIYLIMFALSGCNTPQRALKLIEKGHYEVARAKLKKTPPQDTLNAEIYYVLSLLYADTSYSDYNIDTSFYYVKRAFVDYEDTNPKIREKLQRQIGLDSLALLRQKVRIDSLAFMRTLSMNGVASYQTFIDEHPDASQVPLAVANRNNLAYQATAQIDTYEAYKAFMDTYPDAKEYQQAKERYNSLVFRKKTNAGDLESFVNFLEAFPDSPYRSEAEKQILEITTAANRFEDYERFVRQYPNSKHTALAVNLLFHQYEELSSADDFFTRYPDFPLLDSLKTANQTSTHMLAPVFEENHYGLINSEGKYVFAVDYDLIPSNYLCEGVKGDVVHLAQADNDQVVHQLWNKAGKLIHQFTLPAEEHAPIRKIQQDYLQPVGAGLFLIQDTPDGKILVHQSGKQLLPHADMTSLLDDAALLTSPNTAESREATYQFIKYRVNGLWGLSTFTGKILLKPEYEDIETLSDFVVLYKNGKAAVTNQQSIIEVVNQIPLELSFSYEDISILDDRYLIAYTEDFESVLDVNLNIVVPLDRHNVIRKIENSDLQTPQWLLREDRVEAYVKNDSLLNRTASVYYLYNKEQDRKKSTTYDEVFFSNNWLSLKNEDGFHFVDLQRSNDHQIYDSVKLVGENFALLFKYFDQAKDSVTVLFPNERKLALASPEKISFLLLTPSARGRSRDREYLLIAPQQGPKEVWSQHGQRILMDKFKALRIFETGLFVVEKNRGKGLLDSLGNELVSFRYDEISNYQDGMLAVFQDRKFGAYHYETKTFISPEYETAIRVYGRPVFNQIDSAFSQRYIARKDGQYGIINNREIQRTGFDFDNIIYWNDTAALVQQDNIWSIYRVSVSAPYDEEVDYTLYDAIEEYDLLEAAEGENLYKIYKDGGYGILSNQRGEILAPTYDDIRLLGSISDPHSIFLAEKYVPEAELYIMIHLDTLGNIIKRQALTSEQYDKVFCEG